MPFFYFDPLTSSAPTPAEAAASAIRSADGILITAGAGLGVDSGLPDYRGTEGWWRQQRPGHGEQRYDQLSRPSQFRFYPEEAWDYYGAKLALYRATTPHSGFSLLLKWSRRCRYGSFVFTSNIDGQFQRAGFAEDRIVECHGSVHHLQCLASCRSDIWSVPARSNPCAELQPRCPHCGSLARPNVLMFCDADWLAQRTERQKENLESLLRQVSRPVIIECGAGIAIPTVRQFGERIGHERQATLIRINLHHPQVHLESTVVLQQPAAEALTEIDHFH